MQHKKRGFDDSNPTGRKVKKPKLIDADKKNLKESANPIPNSSEVNFPRGGGSSFTPLEYKLIHREAIKEVEDELFHVFILLSRLAITLFVLIYHIGFRGSQNYGKTTYFCH